MLMPAANPLAQRGLRPAAELAANRPHGDRLRYVGGCRCDACRAANTAYERQRAVARKSGDWNGFVSADKARAHMLQLAAQGVWRRAIADASDVADSILVLIRSGERTTIRARTERRILAVTPEMASDHALIDARDTWKLVRELLKAGFTKTRIARELGHQGRALQLGRRRLTVRNAYQVERLHARLMASDEVLIDARPTWRLIAELRDEWFPERQIARELGLAGDELAIDKHRITRALAQRVAELHKRLTT